jgi:multicomponent Na+:H+ antiporter subunit F
MNFALSLAFGLLTISILLGLIRLARGPTVIDRVLAFDLIATCAVGMIVLLSIQWNTPMYLELVLIFSLLGFLTTVAFVFYLHKTVEPMPEQGPRSVESPPNPES